MSKAEFQRLPGFRDFPPEDFAFRSHVFAAWRRAAVRYGFQEYDGPPLEPLALYVEKSGEEIVGQLFNFSDKGTREVTLRPEMTPSLEERFATDKVVPVGVRVPRLRTLDPLTLIYCPPDSERIVPWMIRGRLD